MELTNDLEKELEELKEENQALRELLEDAQIDCKRLISCINAIIYEANCKKEILLSSIDLSKY